MQLDVFHGLWEVYHGLSPRPGSDEGLSKENPDALGRVEQKAVRKYPVGTHGEHGFADAGAGAPIESYGVIYEFHDRCLRARHLDGDCEELNLKAK